MNKTAQQTISQLLAEKPHLAELVNKFDFNHVQCCFRNITMSPERRAASTITEYASRCDKFANSLDALVSGGLSRSAVFCEDYQSLVSDLKSDFNERLYGLFSDYINSESRCANWMVTGPARFPVERNRKRMQSASNKYDLILQCEEKALKSAKRRLFPEGDGSFINSASSTVVEQLTAEIEALKSQHEQKKKINAIVRKYFPKGSTANATSKTKENCINDLVKSLSITVEQAESYIKPCIITHKVIPFQTYQMQRSLQEISRLESRLAEATTLKEKADNGELDGTLNDGTQYFVDDGRISLKFNGKPSDAVRNLLKKHAFNFSPSRGNLWVRKLTNNARIAFNSSLKPQLNALLADS